MTAVLSPSNSSPATSPRPNQSPSPNSNLSSLQPLMTNIPQKRTAVQRPPSYARNRMSSYSTTSNPSQKPSRPPSHIFPIFYSSLPYALVRDFAYPQFHPLHYGPPSETSAAQSGRSTPANDVQRRLSDPPIASWEASKSQWSAGEGRWASEQLPQMAYGDDHGPPYSEDEDLHSPVVVSSRHKKRAYPNIAGTLGNGRGRSPGQNNSASSKQGQQNNDRAYHTATNGDGSETYYISPDQARQSNSMLFPRTYHSPRSGDPTEQRSSMYENLPSGDSSSLEPGHFNTDESRYSRDYQFTIASPDEEWNGKAVALFDFARENENELPLVEGQVIFVSYRHGQGWLVAEDPKTRESGLVPEEYVRLLRDIEGGWTSLSGELSANDQSGLLSPDASGPDTTNAVTPTQAESGYSHSSHNSVGSSTAGEKRAPVVSSFSTSSKDLKPYPQHLLPTQAGQQPPQVVHYGSTSTTPTVLSPNPPSTSEKRSGDEELLRKTYSGNAHDPKKRKDESEEEDEEDTDEEDSSEEE